MGFLVCLVINVSISIPTFFLASDFEKIKEYQGPSDSSNGHENDKSPNDDEKFEKIEYSEVATSEVATGEVATSEAATSEVVTGEVATIEVVKGKGATNKAINTSHRDVGFSQHKNVTADEDNEEVAVDKRTLKGVFLKFYTESLVRIFTEELY